MHLYEMVSKNDYASFEVLCSFNFNKKLWNISWNLTGIEIQIRVKKGFEAVVFLFGFRNP